MESFPDRTHVWLWIREYEAYLSAREDGEGIDISENPGALHGAWAVHRLVRDGTDYVLFHSAAYGRYLARIEDEDDESYYLVQCTYDSPEQDNVLFQTRGAEDGSDDIIISNRSFGDLCHDHEGTPMHWVVEAIPPRQLPPELPVPPDPIPVSSPSPPLRTPRVGPGLELKANLLNDWILLSVTVAISYWIFDAVLRTIWAKITTSFAQKFS
jgi:hypothetical protein